MALIAYIAVCDNILAVSLVNFGQIYDFFIYMSRTILKKYDILFSCRAMSQIYRDCDPAPYPQISHVGKNLERNQSSSFDEAERFCQ